MRGNDFLDKMNLVDSTFIEKAGAAEKKKPIFWRKWGAAVAFVSAAAVVGVLVFTLHPLPGTYPSENLPESTTDTAETTETTIISENTPPADEGNTIIGGISRNYKDISVASGEAAIEWPWNYLTPAEQYRTVIIEDKEFVSSGRTVDSSLTDGILGTYDAIGYDYIAEQEHRMATEAYRIRGVSEDSMIAIKIGEEYVIFKDRSYSPPATFGELLDNYNLAENLPFHRFSLHTGYTDTGYFSLEDDWYIWQILNECRDAVYVEDDNWGKIEGEYLSFTATSDVLGVYKKVFYVTESGYVKTNVFEYGYTYTIGEEAAEKILTYAKENSTAASFEPYTNSLAGTLVEIADNYILADDTFLCADESKGMVFKIPTDDLRIRRCMTNIDIGDVVVVNFTGDINVAGGNVVTGAYSLSEGTVIDGEVLIPE